ncbi:hypothetical protein [Flavobacterium sp.]|uniref:helix-turn-helix transcriptional regulator n=1 Tax=Flavobacterium sp. TaxID=239 RepID=UPI0039E6E117
MSGLRKTLLLFALLFGCCAFSQQHGNVQLQKGWAALVKDDETQAFRHFFAAYEKAVAENHTADKAESLLYLGICSFGSSLEKGLQYATQSLAEFKKLEPINPKQAKIGRSKCLQLISTIYSRQKKYNQAIDMSREVVQTLGPENDASGTLGLAYSSLGALYEKQKKDSADYFFRMALSDFKKHNNYAYLPNAYIKIGQSLTRQNKAADSYSYFYKALLLADSTQNKQAQVSSYMALAEWHKTHGRDPGQAKNLYQKARSIAQSLTDKSFEIRAIEALIAQQQQTHDYHQVAQLQSDLLKIKDQFYSLEREQIAKSLEVQFEVSEKDRKLALISKEKEVSRLTNYLLAICIGVLLILFGIGYFFLKRLNKRDKQLLKTKEALVEALESQKALKEQQFQNDLEHKESQLSAITLQMLQKNEMVEEIKSAIEKENQLTEQQLLRMVNKYFTQSDSWSDFDLYFESINKNFYTRLKQRYPDISANDLKICALIKLNLSIKEMASILNISPDSVKTARYRLRKKLQLQTEENLTDFILSV